MTEKQQDINKIPDWLLSTDDYIPSVDKEAFLRKTLFSILAKLTFLRQKPIENKIKFFSAPAKLFLTLLTVVLIVASQKLIFPIIILALSIVFLAFLDGRKIIAVLKPAFLAALFATIIILPSIFLENNRIIFLPCKIFITVMLLSYLAQTMPFYQMSYAMRFFCVPNLFILVLDMTLRYIVLLGDTVISLLTSMQLRSVGKNKTKYENMAAILGTTFLKSQAYAKQTYDAMLCRGFTGDYAVKISYKFNYKQIIYLLLALCIICAYIYLEGNLR